MKTVVLDDDPTGTQSASGVRVLFDPDRATLLAALRDVDSVYVQTNTRAVDEPSAVALVTRLRDDAQAVVAALGDELQFVLRGDSTLRGHVFAETEVFLDDGALMLFVPAFPAGGRTTSGGVHLVRIGDVTLPAHRTEYASDPVFPFTTGVLADYVREKSAREPVAIALADVRGGQLADAFSAAPAGAVLLPDAESDDDIRRIADAVRTARAAGTRIVVRSAAPLAAALAGVASDGLLATPLLPSRRRTLLVCGSHTGGATGQLDRVAARWGAPVVVSTDDALTDADATGRAAAVAARARLDRDGLAVLTTERRRRAEHDTLAHGERVMAALTTAVRHLLPDVEVIIAKGGITSSEVASSGIGARSATVLGQVLPGVSVWSVPDRAARDVLYVVVPGNVGGDDTLTDVLASVGC